MYVYMTTLPAMTHIYIRAYRFTNMSSYLFKPVSA